MHVRIIEEEEVRRDDPIQYFLPTGVGVLEGVMAIEGPQNKEISGGRKGVGSAIRRRTNMGSIDIKKRK